jgi:hypothetical protein
MRRILSITAIFALISSMLSPVIAAASCMGTGKAMSCHAGTMPHCDRPLHGHHHQDAAPVESRSNLSQVEDNTKCPMDCCAPGHGQSVAKIAASSVLPLPVVTEYGSGYTSIKFVRAGFSSHTDRGPPSLIG